MRFLTQSESGVLTAFLLASAVLCGATPAAAKDVSFSEQVVPILQEYCLECHSPPEGNGFVESGLDMSSYDALMKGTKHGSIITPGEAAMSNLVVLIEGQADPSIRMPHDKKKMPKKVRNVIRRWINQGARNN